ncbi:MAG: SUMF1/EgtB/PvdO family nonheme iron enzyme [Albidovulum sp.]|nr:SUMF1/EgtB/PvdO family nonheme iron enzyme [Albidovulum sp.]MDE0532742.1 SUMF1/EgtB/PvdO family nonheme iron enzyme [Albidovulum sp.]
MVGLAATYASQRGVLPEDGAYRAGSNRHAPEVAPRHACAAASIQIASSPVANADFREFACPSGHLTDAELRGSRLVLSIPSGSMSPAIIQDCRNDLTHGFDDYSFVKVIYADALAFVDMAGTKLSAGRRRERAASLSQVDREFAWDDDSARKRGRAANFRAYGIPFVRQPGLSRGGTSAAEDALRTRRGLSK